jgi:hypothetical protein
MSLHGCATTGCRYARLTNATSRVEQGAVGSDVVTAVRNGQQVHPEQVGEQ